MWKRCLATAAAEQLIFLPKGEETRLEGTEVSLKIESVWMGEEVEPDTVEFYYNEGAKEEVAL